MKALRMIKTIKSDRLPELNRYKGKKVEIIIFPDINEEEKDKKNIGLLNKLRGTCPNLPDGMEFQQEIRKEWDR